MARKANADGDAVDVIRDSRLSRRKRMRLLVALAVALCAAALAPAAHAVDLILLNGDPPQELSGVNTYGLVYIDNQVRLVGDTTINADTVYFAPNSSLGSCYVAGDNNANACTAGRHLTINATGAVTFSNSITLRPPDNDTPRPGGHLVITAGNITLGGGVATTGRDQGTPGNIVLTAAGSIETQSLTSHGGIVAANGATGVTVNGDIVVDANGNSPASPGQAGSSGHVDLASATGDVLVLGSIFADALNGSAAVAGGNGGTVKIGGRNVRTGFVDAGSGTGADAAAGAAGSIALAAQGWLYALGTLDATGSNSSNSAASGGGAVSLTAGGHVGASEIKVYGGNGPLGGGGGVGGSITISGGSATLGNLDASGGNGAVSGVAGNGGNGGTIVVAAPGTVTLGTTTDARGGTAQRPALAGLGGTVDISAGELTTGFVTTAAGFYPGGTGASPGVSGGPLKLSANGNLTVGGFVTSQGSSASGSADPAHAGGNGGPMTLRAATGVLTLASQANTSGGSGGSNSTDGQPGGAGGHGGSVDVVAPLLGPIASIDADGGEGGDFGDDDGPGGNGGVMRHWGDGSLFSDQFVASNRGGAGNPNGIDGARTVEAAPVNLTIDAAGNLAFQSGSPDAEGFHVSRAVGDGPAEIIATTNATGGVVATSPVCVTALFSVVAYHNLLGWTSGSPAPVSFMTQPPGKQTCGDAPSSKIKKIFKKGFKKTPKKVAIARKKLKRNKWRLPVRFQSKGIGSYDLSIVGPRQLLRATAARGLAAKGKKNKKTAKKARRSRVLSIARGDIPKSGLRKANVVLSKKARKVGAYTLRLRTFAPDGSKKKTLKVRLEVR